MVIDWGGEGRLLTGGELNVRVCFCVDVLAMGVLPDVKQDISRQDSV